GSWHARRGAPEQRAVRCRRHRERWRTVHDLRPGGGGPRRRHLRHRRDLDVHADVREGAEDQSRRGLALLDRDFRRASARAARRDPIWDRLDLCARVAGRLLSEIDDLIPVATGNVVWGVTPLVLSCFLTDKQPPLELIVSVRAVLMAQDGMVFVFEDQGLHVLPGGRREKSEHVLETLAREIG